MQRTWLQSATIATGVIALSLSGCSTTRYLGPLNAVTPVSRSYPANVPRVLSVSGNQAVLGYPGGGTGVVSANSTYVQVETSAGLGAFEGFLVGAALGGAAGAGGCSSGGDCAGAVVIGTVLMGALGALCGAMVGHRTTYVLGPRW
jgi:hypothetical protein